MKRLAALLLALGALAACGAREVETIEPAWHGSIAVDCAGNVTVTSDPPGAAFIGDVTGVGTGTVTATGVLDWPDNDETPAVTDTADNCTPPMTAGPTTTQEPPPSSSTSPSTTGPSPSSSTPTSEPSTSTTASSAPTSTETTASPSTSSPPSVPADPAPATTADNRSYCERYPDRCPGGLPDGEGESG